jgi:Ca2+-binding EF-hand superfamily protein
MFPEWVQVTLHELLWAIVDKVGTDASITDIQDLFHLIDTDSKGFITRYSNPEP